MDTISCPSCNTTNPISATDCIQCGKSLGAIEPNIPQEDLYLEFLDVQLNCWGAASHGMELRIADIPPDVSWVDIAFCCEDAELQPCSGTVQNNQFQKKYSFRLPSHIAEAGGRILLKFTVTLTLNGQTTQSYQGEAFFEVIGTNWAKDMRKNALKGMVLEIRNKGGMIYGSDAQTGQIRKISIDNEFGVIDFEELAADTNNYISWQEQLTPVNEAASHLLLQLGQQELHIFCRAEVLLGRQGDLPLLGDKRISRSHLALFARDGRWYLRDLSFHGTDLDETKVPEDQPPVLTHGMRISIPHPHTSSTYCFTVNMERHPGHLWLEERYRPQAALLLNPEQPATELEGFGIHWTSQGFSLKPRADIPLWRNGLAIHHPISPRPDDKISWGKEQETVTVMAVE